MEAEKDLRGFLVTATLAMLSGYRTTSDVLKQVSHRGAIRMPAYMVKGKCRRDLLPQFNVQRETRTEDCGGGSHTEFDGFTDCFGMVETSLIMTI